MVTNILEQHTVDERRIDTATPADIPSDYRLHRLTIEQYHAMVSAGVLADGDPIELLEGWLVEKVSKNPPHTTATRLIRAALNSLISADYLIDSQEPVTLLAGEFGSEPEPDVFIARGSIADFASRHPNADELPLLVEVADATLQRDRNAKKRIYARASISIYWIVNLIDQQIEVYTDPSGPVQHPDYHQRRDYRRGEELPVVIDGKTLATLAVDALLP